jgi:hypothetical protein|tara:strand:+ start:117 stop:641 length:525 start_codon:yes stop_codon:yes gene_type:complete
MAAFLGQIFPAGGEDSNTEGGIVAIKNLTNNNNFNSSNNIPRDNSAPTTSEGVEIFSTSFAMEKSTNKLLFLANLYGNEDSNQGDNLVFPFFAGSTCIFVGYHDTTSGSAEQNFRIAHAVFMYEPGTTSSVTYSVRGGVDSGNYEHLETTTYSQGSHYNSLRRSTLTIMEVSSS